MAEYTVDKDGLPVLPEDASPDEIAHAIGDVAGPLLKRFFGTETIGQSVEELLNAKLRKLAESLEKKRWEISEEPAEEPAAEKEWTAEDALQAVGDRMREGAHPNALITWMRHMERTKKFRLAVPGTCATLGSGSVVAVGLDPYSKEESRSFVLAFRSSDGERQNIICLTSEAAETLCEILDREIRGGESPSSPDVLHDTCPDGDVVFYETWLEEAIDANVTGPSVMMRWVARAAERVEDEAVRAQALALLRGKVEEAMAEATDALVARVAPEIEARAAEAAPEAAGETTSEGEKN